MSSRVSALPRRNLNARQSETVERLYQEASSLLAEVGHDQLTIRVVATRAGVSAATAYNYFASKDHLFAELFLRLIEADRGPDLTATAPVERLRQAGRHLAELVGASPELAAAVNKSLMSSDPEVDRLRRAIGAGLAQRFREAVGDDVYVDPEVFLTLGFVVSGAMLQAGIGIFTYPRLADHLDTAFGVVGRGVHDDPAPCDCRRTD